MRISLSKWEVIKLMMACTAASQTVTDERSKTMWSELHDKLNEALEKEENR